MGVWGKVDPANWHQNKISSGGLLTVSCRRSIAGPTVGGIVASPEMVWLRGRVGDVSSIALSKLEVTVI